jgi:MFS transporter, DHA1 family, inner membrane transport protein
MTRKQLLLLYLLAFVQFCIIADFMIIMPLAPSLKNMWHISSAQFSRVVSIFSIGAFISAIIFISFVDRFDRKKILLIILAGFTIGTFLCGLSQSYNQLLAARLITGLFGGIAGSVVLSMVADIVAPSHRGEAMGILMTGFSLASVLGVPAGIWLAANYAWHTPFMVLGTLSALVFILVFAVLPNFTKHIQQQAPKQSILQILQIIFTNKIMRIALLLGAIMQLAHFTVVPFFSDYFVNNLGFSLKTTIPLMYVIGGAFSAFTSPRIGRLSDKYGRLKVLVVLTILSVIPLVGLTNLQSHNQFILFALVATFFIFSGSRMIVTNAQITSAADANSRGSFLIINNSVQHLAAGLAGVIGGFVIENDVNQKILHYPTLGIIAVIFSFLTLWLFYFIKQKQAKVVANI